MERVKLLSMTAILTVLIWAGADSLVNETEPVRVTFTVEPQPNTNMIVSLDPDAESQVYELHIAGPRNIMDNIEEPLNLRITVPDRPTGSASIPLDRDAIQRSLIGERSDFRKITIVSVQPPTLPVRVDHWINRQLTFTMKRLAMAYDEPPQVQPTLVTLRIPETTFQDLPQNLQSQIDISAEIERALRERTFGILQEVRVRPDPTPYGPQATLTPPEVVASATVRADRVTEEIPTVPIKLVVSFANLARPYYAVGRDGSMLELETKTIKVTGPAEDVGRLLHGETRAYGFVQLKEVDLEVLGVFKAWTPEFFLPSNIELAEPPEPIEFKLIDGTKAVLNPP